MIQIPNTKIAFHELNLKEEFSSLVLQMLGIKSKCAYDVVKNIKCDDDCTTYFVWMPPFQRMVHIYEHLDYTKYGLPRRPTFAEFINKAREMKDEPDCPDMFKPQTGIDVDHIVPFNVLPKFLKSQGIDFSLPVIDTSKYKWAEETILELYHEDFYPFRTESKEGLISVIIPAFNEEANIRKCLDSILKNSYKNIEVIVVDDCSTDNTPNVLNEYKDRISIVRNKVNLGLGASRLSGLPYARGEYISFIDADDYISNDFYEKLYNCAKEHEADIAQANVVSVDGSTRKTFGYEPQVLVGAEKIHKFFLKETMFHNSCIIKRELFDIVRYSTNRYVEDVPTNMKLRYYANKIAYTGAGDYYYRMNPQSLSHTSNQVKDAIYTAYSALTIIEFLNSKEEEYHVPYNIFFDRYKALCEMKPSDVQLLEYAPIVSKLLAFAINNSDKV